MVKKYMKLMSLLWNFMSIEYVGLAIGVIAVVLSGICYGMTSNFALFITQLVVGLVLTIQSFVAAKNTKCQILKINKKIGELRVSYIDSPKYLYAMVDAEDHVIFCVRRDGTIDWALGVPQPIRKEIERLEKKIDEQK